MNDGDYLDRILNGEFEQRLTELAEEIGLINFLALINSEDVQALFKLDARALNAWLKVLNELVGGKKLELIMQVPTDSTLPQKWNGKTLLIWVGGTLFCKYRSLSCEERDGTVPMAWTRGVDEITTELQALLTMGKMSLGIAAEK